METPVRSADVPAQASGWRDLFMRAVKIAAVGFIVLQAKELVDAGMLDTKATAIDAVLVAAGVFLLDVLLKWAGPKR